MITANVTVIFEAADELEAERIVEGWALHDGSQVSMTISASRTGTADSSGHVELELPQPPPPMPAPPPPDIPPV
jgi:hypothetical protein